MSRRTPTFEALLVLVVIGLGGVACAPAGPAGPTAAPARPTEALKPAVTTAPAKPTEAPVAKPAPKPTEKPAAKLAEKTAPKPTEKPAPKPAAKFDEKAVAEFYRGKTIRIIVGSAPGGGFDLYARALARYLPQYVPGAPNVIVENRPGAGTMLTANTVYNTEPKDGTFVGTFAEGTLLQKLMGDAGAQFDPVRYQWLGAATRGLYACVARTDSGIKSIQDTLGGKELVVGTEGPGSDIHAVPAVIRSVLGANLKLVPGYGGFSRVKLALEAKEVDGFCATFLVIASQGKALLEGENPTARIILLTDNRSLDHPFTKGVPAWEGLAKTEEDRQILRLADAPRQMSKPYAVAPDVPEERVAALRRALAAAFADPKLVEELEKAGQDVQFVSPDEVTRVVQQIMSAPSPIVARLQDILK